MLSKQKYFSIGILALILIVLISVIANAVPRRPSVQILDGETHTLSEWQIASVDGLSESEIQDIINGKTQPDWISYTAPGVPKLGATVDRFVARTKLPDIQLNDPAVLLEMYDHHFKAFQNGTMIYSYGVKNGEFVDDMLGNDINFIRLQNGYEGEWLYFDALSLLKSNTGYVKAADFANFSDLVLTIAREGFFRFPIAGLLLLGGFVFILFYRSKEVISFLHVGVFSMLIGLWFLFDSNRSLALIGINPLLAQYIGLFSLYLAPVAFGLFLRDALKDTSWSAKIIDILLVVNLVYFVVVCILDLFFHIRIVQTLFIFHGIIFAWVLGSFVRVIYCCIKKVDGSKILALAFVIMAVTVLIETMGLVLHIAILQMGYVSYAMIAFVAVLGYLPIQKVARLHQQVRDYSVEITKTNTKLENMIFALSHVLEHQSRESLALEIFEQLAEHIISESYEHDVPGLVALRNDNEWDVILATGGCRAEELTPYKNLQRKEIIFEGNQTVLCFFHNKKTECIILVKDADVLTENDKRFVEIYFTCVYAAYKNLRLYSEVIASQENIIYVLGEIAESKSHFTGLHIQRVAKYSQYIGLKYGMSEKEANVLKIASVMHDIGKLSTPEEILNKPAKLTPQEFDIIKRHTKDGYNLLYNSSGDIIQAAAIIALEHHEKYDGTGYAGIKGEAIHLYARIVAIADVFDALMSKRPYKEPWAIEDIVELFKKESGKHFDPKLVTILLNGLPDILEISKKFADDCLC